MARRKKLVEEEVVEEQPLAEEEQEQPQEEPTIEEAPQVIEVEQDIEPEIVVQKLSLEDRYKELQMCPKEAKVILYQEYPFAEVSKFLASKIGEFKKARLKGCCK